MICFSFVKHILPSLDHAMSHHRASRGAAPIVSVFLTQEEHAYIEMEAAHSPRSLARQICIKMRSP